VRWAATEVRADRFIQRLAAVYESEVREPAPGYLLTKTIDFFRARAPFDPALLILRSDQLDRSEDRAIDSAGD